MTAKDELNELLDKVELDLHDASDLREVGDAHDALLAARRRLDEAIDAAVANGRSHAEVASRIGTSRQAVHKRLAKKTKKTKTPTSIRVSLRADQEGKPTKSRISRS
jgi:DNA-directed RNA polymerase specialized sigma24 family protein